jgi:hypothetical protein
MHEVDLEGGSRSLCWVLNGQEWALNDKGTEGKRSKSCRSIECQHAYQALAGDRVGGRCENHLGLRLVHDSPRYRWSENAQSGVHQACPS